LYFFNCQLFTTPPRFEISTRYSAFSTTIVRSCVSVFGGIAAALGGEIAVAFPAGNGAPDLVEEGEVATVEGEVVAEVVEAGAVTAGLFACGKFAGGFGAKNLAQSKITAIDSIDAISMRNSDESSFFFSGALTNGPLWE
jgi:hypothetical protein